MFVSWNDYDLGKFFDEFIQFKGKLCKYVENLVKFLVSYSLEELEMCKVIVELFIKEMGIIFMVYIEEEGFIDCLWLFDIMLCMIVKFEWSKIELGLK